MRVQLLLVAMKENDNDTANDKGNCHLRMTLIFYFSSVSHVFEWFRCTEH